MMMTESTLRAGLSLSSLPCQGHSRRLQQRPDDWEREGERENYVEGWGRRAGEVGGPRGRMGGLRGHRQKGPGRRGFVEGWTNLGGEDQGQDRMGVGCSKVTSEDTMGALPRGGEVKKLKAPHSTYQRQSQGL